MQISLTALVIHSGHAALPVPPVLFTLQLPTFQSGKTLARHDALGLWVLDRIRSFRPFRRLLFFARHDVLSKVSMIDKLVILIIFDRFRSFLVIFSHLWSFSNIWDNLDYFWSFLIIIEKLAFPVTTFYLKVGSIQGKHD